MRRARGPRTHRRVAGVLCAVSLLSLAGCLEEFAGPGDASGGAGGRAGAASVGPGGKAGAPTGNGGAAGRAGSTAMGGSSGGGNAGSSGRSGGTSGGNGASAGAAGAGAVGGGGAVGGTGGVSGGGGATGGKAGSGGTIAGSGGGSGTTGGGGGAGAAGAGGAGAGAGGATAGSSGTGGAPGGSGGGPGGKGGAPGGNGGNGGAAQTARLYYAPPGKSALFAYDPNTNLWTEKTSAPGDIHAMTAHGGVLYAKRTHATMTLYRYTPVSDKWDIRAAAPSGSSQPAHLVASDKHVYYFANDSDVYRYDPSADSWSTRAPLPVKRGQSDSFEYAGGAIYHLAWDTRVLRRYDVATGTWSEPLATLPSRVYGFQDLQQVSGRIYATHGQTNADVYDPATKLLSVAWLPPAQVMTVDPTGEIAFAWSGLGGPDQFRRCVLATQMCAVLAGPPSAIYGHAWVYVP